MSQTTNKFGRRAASAGNATTPAPGSSVGAPFRTIGQANNHRLTIDVDDELYRRLKLASIDTNQRMSVLVRDLLAQHLP
jgi:hypothetical protein